MAAEHGESRGSRTVNLHPLVIINITDHYTRVKVGKQPNTIVLGALFGVQDGLTVHIYDSFELKFDNTGADGITLDENYVRTKQEQFSAVFPDFELLGWYTTGSNVTKREMSIHKMISAFNESPLFLQIDTNIGPETKALPITINESVLHVVQDVPTMVFVDVEYKLQTSESERISVDHVARQAPQKSDLTSSVEPHLKGLHSSVSTLVQRVSVLQDYLEATKQGQIPKNHAMLREVASVVNQLPVVDPSGFRDDFLSEYNDALLVTYLATMTKGVAQANKVVDKFDMTNDKGKRYRF